MVKGKKYKTSNTVDFEPGSTPVEINLLGDKTKQIEAPEHFIKFPGGHIGVTRTTDNRYWIHVHLNSGEQAEYIPDVPEFSHFAELLKLQYTGENRMQTIEIPEETNHFAFEIKPYKP